MDPSELLDHLRQVRQQLQRAKQQLALRAVERSLDDLDDLDGLVSPDDRPDPGDDDLDSDESSASGPSESDEVPPFGVSESDSDDDSEGDGPKFDTGELLEQSSSRINTFSTTSSSWLSSSSSSSSSEDFPTVTPSFLQQPTGGSSGFGIRMPHTDSLSSTTTSSTTTSSTTTSSSESDWSSEAVDLGPEGKQAGKITHLTSKLLHAGNIKKYPEAPWLAAHIIDSLLEGGSFPDEATLKAGWDTEVAPIKALDTDTTRKREAAAAGIIWRHFPKDFVDRVAAGRAPQTQVSYRDYQATLVDSSEKGPDGKGTSLDEDLYRTTKSLKSFDSGSTGVSVKHSSDEFDAYDVTPVGTEHDLPTGELRASNGEVYGHVRTLALTDDERDDVTLGKDDSGRVVRKDGSRFDTTTSKAVVQFNRNPNPSEPFVLSEGGELRSQGQKQMSRGYDELQEAKRKLKAARGRYVPESLQEARDFGFPSLVEIAHHSSYEAVRKGPGKTESKPVIGAGEIRSKDGRITEIGNQSGHYLPGSDDLSETVEQLDRKGMMRHGLGEGGTTVKRYESKYGETQEVSAIELLASGGDEELLLHIHRELKRRGRTAEDMREELVEGYRDRLQDLDPTLSKKECTRLAEEAIEAQWGDIETRYERTALKSFRKDGDFDKLLTEAELEFQVYLNDLLKRRRELEELRGSGIVERMRKKLTEPPKDDDGDDVSDDVSDDEGRDDEGRDDEGD